MNAFYQRLKELDRQIYEKFCLHLLRERHPGMEIKHVDGSQGDQGVDLFAGELDGSPTIWQCKHFTGGVAKSQREQIRLSLKEALKHHNPKAWILCLPIDLDVRSHRWFQRLAHSYADRVAIKLMQGTDMAHELIHRQSLRDRFFPDAVMETMHLRELLGKTSELTTEELADVTTENVDKYLDRLKQRDARFNYEIVFSRDMLPVRRVSPGLVASFADEKKTINIFARDTDAIRRNPPRGSFSLHGTGVDKFNELLETGKAQHFTSDEVTDFSSDLLLILPTRCTDGCQLDVGPNRPQEDQTLNTRLTFGSGESSVVYEWIQFEISRVGTREAELVSKGDLPFRMSIVVRADATKPGRLNIALSPVGAEVRDVQKIIRAFDQISASKRIELFDLREGRSLFNLCAGDVGSVTVAPGFRRLVADCVTVAEHYGVQIRVPDKVSPQEIETLSLLVSMAKNVAQDIRSIEMTLVKSLETTPEIRKSLRSPNAFMVTNQEILPRPVLFGTEVPTGRVVWHAERASVKNAKAFEKQLSHAATGEALKLVLVLLGPLRIGAQGTSESLPVERN